MNKLENIAKENDYVITDKKCKNKKILNFKDSEEFLKWIMQNKNKKIAFYTENDKEIKKQEIMYEFLKYYFKTKEKCELKMADYNDLFSKGYSNKFLTESLSQFVSSNKGGKFLRATLIAMGYQIKQKDDNFLPLAMALEIFQTSILIHDDIIDKADKRRGLDTIPIKYQKIYESPIKKQEQFEEKRKDLSDSMALCLGDLGFYLALQIITNNYQKNENLSKVLSYYNNVAIKTCEGEMVDVILPFYEEFYGSENVEEHVMEIYKLKTAWYSVVGPYCMGAILGGLEEAKINALEDALLNLGIAFQIKDDLLGIFGDEKHIGKSTTSDVSEFKQTILYSHIINTKYKDELLKYYGKENITQSEMEKVKKLFEQSGSKKYAQDYMEKLFKESFEAILKLDFLDIESKKLLLGFAQYLKERSK
ncbi:MAG: polyprenyl synthetase family protein [Bacilli bacterium]|nr:polyprenyl synthetase family protein [Bacilli bacterium]